MVNKHNINIKQILIASDHAGYPLKEIIKKYLINKRFKVLDLGTNSKNISVDYPIYAKKLSKKINSKNCGILVCGSGIGMSIASNRFKNVRSVRRIQQVLAGLLSTFGSSKSYLAYILGQTQTRSGDRLWDLFYFSGS